MGLGFPVLLREFRFACRRMLLLSWFRLLIFVFHASFFKGIDGFATCPVACRATQIYRKFGVHSEHNFTLNSITLLFSLPLSSE